LRTPWGGDGMRGHRKRLSAPRRIISDLMRLARDVPSFVVQREMDLAALVAARDAHAPKPPWTSLFAKAYALTAQEFPPLRQVYLPYPWPHLYEYAGSAANISIARDYRGESAAFGLVVRNPAARPLAEIGGAVAHAAIAPVEDIPDFARALQFAALPLPIRRPLFRLLFNVARPRGKRIGTFGLSSVTAMGAELIHPNTVLTTVLGYGMLRDNGTITVRITFDHRVLDGATAARALARLEQVLNGPILRELNDSAAHPRVAV
jgi:pyruvate/2-oxoglutarate dehydrogenase complex dihydrolipoamide acyltransferase (E2) component